MRLGDFTLVREIDAGGMGVVYEAVQHHPSRTVALKVLRSDIRASSERFAREAEMLARLHHPNICDIYQSGVAQVGGKAVPFFAMEYVVGGKPITRFARESRLTDLEKIELIVQCASAVQHGHDRGIIHRDLKPANLLVDANGNVKLIDFGVARGAMFPLDPSAGTLGDSLLGTLQYMSPEQCTGDAHAVGARSDIYSLAVVAYELLTGRLPYDLSGLGIAAAARVIAETEPLSPSSAARGLGSGVEAVLLRSLAKAPHQRHESVQEFAHTLRLAATTGQPDGKPGAGGGARPRPTPDDRAGRKMVLRRLSRIVAAMVVGLSVAWLTSLPRVFKYTPGPAFDRWISQHPPMGMVQDFADNVVIAEITDDTPIRGIASTAGIEGVSDDIRQARTLRGLHARAIRRLVPLGARAVVFDLRFTSASPFDEDFAAAIREARDAGIPVLAVAPKMSPAAVVQVLRRELTLGSDILGAAERSGRVTNYLAVEQRGVTLPFLAMAVAANLSCPAGVPEYSIDEPANLLRVRYRNPGEDPNRGYRPEVFTVRLEGVLTRRETDFVSGIEQGARLALAVVPIPPDDVIQRARLPYSELFDSGDGLRKQVAGRVVLLTDIRKGQESILKVGPDRTIPGSYAMAASIHAALDGGWIRVAGRAERLSVAAASCLVAVALVVRFKGRWLAGLAAVLAMIGVMLLLGVFSYSSYGVLLNPLPAILGIILAAAVAMALGRRRSEFDGA